MKQESFEATMCKTEVDDGASDAEHEEQKARDRFLNERNNVIKRSNTNGIPDTLGDTYISLCKCSLIITSVCFVIIFRQGECKTTTIAGQ